MAGYSKRSLADKLGIKPGMTCYFGNKPDGYFGELGENIKEAVVKDELSGEFDFIQYFVKERSQFEKLFPKLKKALVKNGMLWISWPKGSSGVQTDLNENIVMEIGLKNGLVDVKVAAVDDTWSGLKFVYRLKDR